MVVCCDVEMLDFSPPADSPEEEQGRPRSLILLLFISSLYHLISSSTMDSDRSRKVAMQRWRLLIDVSGFFWFKNCLEPTLTGAGVVEDGGWFVDVCL